MAGVPCPKLSPVRDGIFFARYVEGRQFWHFVWGYGFNSPNKWSHNKINHLACTLLSFCLLSWTDWDKQLETCPSTWLKKSKLCRTSINFESCARLLSKTWHTIRYYTDERTAADFHTMSRKIFIFFSTFQLSKVYFSSDTFVPVLSTMMYCVSIFIYLSTVVQREAEACRHLLVLSSVCFDMIWGAVKLV